MTGLERGEDDASSSPFDAGAARNISALPIRAFDDDVRCEPLNDLCRRVIVKDDDGVHTREAGQYFGPLTLRRDGAIGALLEASYGCVRVDPHDQNAAEVSRVLEIAEMADVQQVEDTVRKDDHLAGSAFPFDERRGVFHGEDRHDLRLT